jgi:hypothetical protein
MLVHLRGGGISARKRRLFACGCCKLIWPLLSTPGWRNAVEVAAQTADGKATNAQRQAAVLWLNDGYRDTGGPVDHAAEAVLRATNHDASHANAIATSIHVTTADPASQPKQAVLLRELVGNPFSKTVTSQPRWFTWNEGAVRKLAVAAYEDRARFVMAILADALEDAGCADVELLGHLRGPGPHVRGCWAVDLILGRK